MWLPWTFGLGSVLFLGALGLAAWASGVRGLRKMHGSGLVPLAAWVIVGGLWVIMDERPTVFDQGMVLGLALMIGLTGYVSPKHTDPGWSKGMHGVLGLVIAAWFGVLAHRFGEW
jgi:hypothetical protein